MRQSLTERVTIRRSVGLVVLLAAFPVACDRSPTSDIISPRVFLERATVGSVVTSDVSTSTTLCISQSECHTRRSQTRIAQRVIDGNNRTRDNFNVIAYRSFALNEHWRPCPCLGRKRKQRRRIKRLGKCACQGSNVGCRPSARRKNLAYRTNARQKVSRKVLSDSRLTVNWSFLPIRLTTTSGASRTGRRPNSPSIAMKS